MHTNIAGVHVLALAGCDVIRDNDTDANGDDAIPAATVATGVDAQATGTPAGVEGLLEEDDDVVAFEGQPLTVPNDLRNAIQQR